MKSSVVFQKNTKIQQYNDLEMKIQKCFLSDRFSVFLNTFAYGGAKLLNSAKVYLKLGISNKAEHISMPERFREVHSWTLSANKNGANWYASHVCYLWECIRLVYAADRVHPPEGLNGAFQLYMPVALGGYGLVPFHLCNATVGRLPLSEAVTFLKEASKVYKEVQPMFAIMLNKGARLKTGASFIRAPQTFTSTDPHMTEMRMTSFLERHVSQLTKGAYVGDIFSLYSEDNLHALGENVVDIISRISLVSIDKLYSITPERAIATIISKFRKSSTMTDLIGHRALTRIIKLDRAEIARVNKAWAGLTNYI